MIGRNIRKIVLGLLLFVAPLCVRGDYAVEKSRVSVVRIICVHYATNVQAAGRISPKFGKKERIPVSFGTGFVIGDKGLIATNDHVASMGIWKDPALQANVDRKALIPELYVGRLNSSGSAEIYPATLVWNDHGKDLALIQAENLTAPPLTMNISEPQAADTVYAMGYPGLADLPDDWQAVQGWIDAGRPVLVDSPSEAMRRFLTVTVNKSEVRRPSSAAWMEIDHYAKGPVIPMIETDCQFSPGNSGGPLINIAGQVIGVNTAIGVNTSNASQNHYSSQIVVLHEEMGTRFPHSFTSSRPWAVSVWLVAAIACATLLGIGGIVIGLRKRQTMGRTTMLGILREERARGQWTGSPNEEPPLLPGEVPDRDSRGGLEKTQLDGSRPNYASFELSPKDHDGSLVQLDGQRFARQRGRLILGRSSELAHICLDDRNVSNRHAAVRVRGSKLYIEDLESSNGTRVNGKLLEPFSDALISVGDTISLGSLHYRLREGRTS